MTALQKKIISHLPKEPQSLCGRKKTSTLIVVCFFLHVFTLQQSVREERGPRTGNAATATGSGVYWYVSLQHFYHWPNSVYNAWLTFYDLLSTITRWKMLILQKGFWKKALKANKIQTLWVYMHVCVNAPAPQTQIFSSPAPPGSWTRTAATHRKTPACPYSSVNQPVTENRHITLMSYKEEKNRCVWPEEKHFTLPHAVETPSFWRKRWGVSPELSSIALSPYQTVSFPPGGNERGTKTAE